MMLDSYELEQLKVECYNSGNTDLYKNLIYNHIKREQFEENDYIIITKKELINLHISLLKDSQNTDN